MCIRDRLTIGQLSCSDGDNSSIGGNNGVAPICLPTEISTPYERFVYSYNNQDRVVEKQVYYGETKRYQLTFTYSTNFIEILEKNESDNSPAVKKHLIKFNSDGNPTEQLHLPSNLVKRKFVYNGKQLSYYIDNEDIFDISARDSCAVKWDTQGNNIIEETRYDYNKNENKFIFNRTVLVSSDDKSNPFFKNWGANSYEGPDISPYEHLCKNNVLKYGSEIISYTYTTKNYPLQQSGVKIFEYQCK